MSALNKAQKWYIDATIAATKRDAEAAGIEFTGIDEQMLRRQLSQDVKQADPQHLIAMYEAHQRGGRGH